MSPFQVLTRQITLKAKDRKPVELGPKVRIDAVRAGPGDSPGLGVLIQSAGLGDWDKDGFKEQSPATNCMWLGARSTDFYLEFELPEPVPLAAVEVWNYNAEWQTAKGVRQADIAVSADGVSWQTVQRAVELAEAEGSSDYDTPAVIKLNGITAKKLRLQNLVAWNGENLVGLSKVVLHEARGKRVAVVRPEDGAAGVGVRQALLEWRPGEGAAEHRVFLGNDPAHLESLGSVKESRFQPADLKADTTYYWRVDEVQPDGNVIAGRIHKFTAASLVGWWKLNQASGTVVADAGPGKFEGQLSGKANWQAIGPLGGALELDGQGTFIDLGNRDAFNLCDAVSVSVWVKVRAFDKPWQAILAKGDDGWRLRRQNQAQVLTFDCNGLVSKSSDGARVGAAGRRPVTDNQWHHVVGLYDGTQLALYMDGELESSTPATGQIRQNARPLLVGKDFNRTDRSWNGWLADLRVYGYALTADEIKALYRAGQKGDRAAK